MSEQQLEASPKTRSPIERFVVWGGIIILGIVVLIEFQAQRNFNGAMEWLRDNELKGKSVGDVRAAMSGASEFDVDSVGGEAAQGFKWFSLFKDYQVVVNLTGTSDSSKLTGYFDPVAMKLVEQEMTQESEKAADAEQKPDEELE